MKTGKRPDKANKIKQEAVALDKLARIYLELPAKTKDEELMDVGDCFRVIGEAIANTGFSGVIVAAIGQCSITTGEPQLEEFEYESAEVKVVNLGKLETKYETELELLESWGIVPNEDGTLGGGEGRKFSLEECLKFIKQKKCTFAIHLSFALTCVQFLIEMSGMEEKAAFIAVKKKWAEHINRYCQGAAISKIVKSVLGLDPSVDNRAYEDSKEEFKFILEEIQEWIN